MSGLDWLRSMAVASAFALAACGGTNNNTNPDASTTTPDATMADAGVDAATATFSGTVAVHDVTIFGVPTAGAGGQIDISFTKDVAPVEGVTVVKHYDNSAAVGDLLACSADLVDVTNEAMNNPDRDEGDVQIVITGTSAPTVPTCKFLGASYYCPSASGTAGTIAGTMAPFTFTDTSATPADFTSQEVGEYLVVTGDPGKGGAFPIVASPGGHALALAASEAPPATVGSWMAAAGIGPVPGGPTFLPADAKVKVTVNANSKGDADFAMTDLSEFSAGREFTLDTATQALLAAKLNLETTDAITFGCGGAGGTCDTVGVGMLVVIDSSDSTSADPTDLDTGAHYRGTLTCPNIGPSVAVKAEALNVLAAGTPTKLRISVFRDNFTSMSSITVVAGHGIVAFQDLR